MLTKVKKLKHETEGSFAIVASEYNALYVDAMLSAAKAELKRAGASVKIVRSAGSV